MVRKIHEVLLGFLTGPMGFISLPSPFCESKLMYDEKPEFLCQYFFRLP